MNGSYPRHWARIFNTPLMVAPHSLDAMLPAIDRVLRGEALTNDDYSDATKAARPSGVAYMALGDTGDAPADGSDSPIADRNLGVIFVSGPLVNRGRYDANCLYMTGYNDISAAIDTMLAEASVDQIAMIFDSPGGEVGGLFDLNAKVAEAAKSKPIHGMVAECACSAAYLLASACTSLSITQTGIAGSIGVVMRHVDYSAWMKNEGVKVTQIYAGSHKVDGNPYEPLPKDVREKFQGQIDTLYAMFTGAVAENRGIQVQAVVDTQADFFMGQAAIDHGLADRIETSEAMISRLTKASAAGLSLPRASASTPETTPEDSTMAMSIAVLAALALAESATDQEVLGAIDAKEKAAAAAENARIFGILSLPEAEGRVASAISVAKVNTITIEAAKGILSTLPKASSDEPKKPAADNNFARVMTSLGNPDIGADEEDNAAGGELKVIRAGWDAALGQTEMR